MAESASQVEMGLEYPRTELPQVGMDFEPVETADAAADIAGEGAEIADAAAEIAGEGAEVETADVAADRDLPEMDLPRAEASAPSVPSSCWSKNSGYSDYAIQRDC